jgi:hypothetical protein
MSTWDTLNVPPSSQISHSTNDEEQQMKASSPDAASALLDSVGQGSKRKRTALDRSQPATKKPKRNTLSQQLKDAEEREGALARCAIVTPVQTYCSPNDACREVAALEARCSSLTIERDGLAAVTLVCVGPIREALATITQTHDHSFFAAWLAEHAPMDENTTREVTGGIGAREDQVVPLPVIPTPVQSPNAVTNGEDLAVVLEEHKEKISVLEAALASERKTRGSAETELEQERAARLDADKQVEHVTKQLKTQRANLIKTEKALASAVQQSKKACIC